jgi:hypothetical protein
MPCARKEGWDPIHSYSGKTEWSVEILPPQGWMSFLTIRGPLFFESFVVGSTKVLLSILAEIAVIKQKHNWHFSSVSRSPLGQLTYMVFCHHHVGLDYTGF